MDIVVFVGIILLVLLVAVWFFRTQPREDVRKPVEAEGLPPLALPPERPRARAPQALDRDASLEEIRRAIKIAVSYETRVGLMEAEPSRPIPEDMGLAEALHTDAVPPGPIFAIDYTDVEGRSSRRIIAARKCDGYTLEAFCFGRGEERRFRVDRIRELFDPFTGVVHASIGDALLYGQQTRKQLMAERRRAR